MPTPILTLPAQWEVSKKVTLATLDTELGDEYLQTMPLGLSPEIIEWSVTSPALTTLEKNTIVSQLEQFAGVAAFRWSPDNGVTIAYRSYFCEQWTVTPLGVNAWQIDATFRNDNAAECVAFAANIDTAGAVQKIEQAIAYLNTYTRDTLPLISNAQGVTVNAFHDVLGRGGYFPGSAGTSEGQAIILKAVALTRTLPGVSLATKNTALTLATLYANGLRTYFYNTINPPNPPNSALWLPHWLVNAKAPFVSKGILAAKYINSGYFGVTVNFTNGVGNIPSGGLTNGEKVSDVYRVYSTNGQLLWKNIYSPLVSGTNYEIDYWVSNAALSGLGGTTNRYFPTSASNSGQSPTPTAESPGKVVLKNTSFTGLAIVVYIAYTGATINKNIRFDSYPLWRPTLANEANVATDTWQWLYTAYQLMYEQTGNIVYQRAAEATAYSATVSAEVLNDSYLFKKDADQTEPFSYPGTQLIVANNTAGRSASRLGDGWVQASINNGSEAFPVAELQNFAVSIQMQTGVDIEYEVACSQTTILELAFSTSRNAFDLTQTYTYWLPVTANVTATGSLKPTEFIKWTNNTIWHSTIADNPIYTYSGAGGSATTTRVIETISSNRRFVSKVTLTQPVGGFCGAGLVFFNEGNQPPSIRYSTNNSSVRLKVNDGNSASFYWNLPATSGNFQTFTPTWANADVKPTAPSDANITAIEFVLGDNTSGSAELFIFYAGADPEVLPIPVFTFKSAIVSRVTSAHTFKVGDFRGKNSPLNELKGSPGVLPFTVNSLDGLNIDAFRGNPNVGYQSPIFWHRLGLPSRVEQVLDFCIDAQTAYTAQSLNGTVGYVVTSFNWASWENGANPDTVNQFDFFGSVDPSYDWAGYQYRIAVEMAAYWMAVPSSIKAQSFTMNFLGAIDRFYRKNAATTGNRPSTNIPAQTDPVSNYHDPHGSALIARAALYANVAGGNPAITIRVLFKALAHLESQYVSSGSMSGTWSKDQPSFTVGSTTYKEYFAFWHGEIITTYCELLKYVNQITYPSCDTSLS